MPTSYSDLLRVAKQATGENNNTWGNIVNANSFEMFEDAIAGMATLSLAGSGTYTLSTANGATDEARMAVLKGTGLMTAARNIVVPSTTKTYVVQNATTGGFDMVVKTAAGSGVNVAMGVTKTVYCDGTNVIEVSTNTTPADGIIAKDCVSLTSASSPYSVTSADSGKMLVVDTSGGAVIVNLPSVASQANPFNFGVYKLTGDANTITINRSGSDVIGSGNTSISIARQEGVFLLVDPDPVTDRWVPVGFGATVTTGQQQSQTFTGGTDYTAGSTTTLTLTTTPIAPSSVALDIYFDGVYQHSSEWSYNPSTGLITFGSAIPLGVLKVFCKWQSVSLPIGTPSDGTVSTIKLIDGSVTAVKMSSGAATNGQVPIANGSGGVAYATLSTITQMTPVTASGTSVSFTGLPAGVKRVTIGFDALSTNGSDYYILQIGPSGGVETTGYVSQSNGASATNGFLINSANSANVHYGAWVLTLIDSSTNTWVCSGAAGTGGTSLALTGSKSLAGVLSRLTITTNTGANSFDSGKINVVYEV